MKIIMMTFTHLKRIKLILVILMVSKCVQYLFLIELNLKHFILLKTFTYQLLDYISLMEV